MVTSEYGVYRRLDVRSANTSLMLADGFCPFRRGTSLTAPAASVDAVPVNYPAAQP